MNARPNFEIIRALKMNHRSQRWLAQTAGIHETSVSLIVNGRLMPNERQASAIATALGIPETLLFA